MAKEYMRRVLEAYIEECLDSIGALLIEGAKWSGKTRTAKQFAKSTLSITNDNQIKTLTHSVENGSFGFLDKEPPLLIDEWQEVPGIWDAVRFKVDDRGERGQFILTGSSVPCKGAVRHSGAGRIAKVTMRPMSLFESKESNGQVSLRRLFEEEPNADGSSDLTLEEISQALARGGWPESIGDRKEGFARAASNYLKAIIDSDVSNVDGVRRDAATVRRIVGSVARNISTFAS
ncbi:MAG: AAA family ATPase [Candidatus Methanoplasma sp.]|jgi:predicted AAA+ superfamily ATPase|nr:AAA family ATPase [Candidatus Methanoplasma sp.]